MVDRSLLQSLALTKEMLDFVESVDRPFRWPRYYVYPNRHSDEPLVPTAEAPLSALLREVENHADLSAEVRERAEAALRCVLIAGGVLDIMLTGDEWREFWEARKP